jgi:hypothetical protein
LPLIFRLSVNFLKTRKRIYLVIFFGGKIMSFSKPFLIILSIFSTFFFLACGGGGGGDTFSTTPTGTLSVSMTDSAGPYKAVYVTVKELQVHLGGNENNKGSWRTLEGFSKKTINLCSLTNGVFEDLGTTVLIAWKYTQMRLILCDEFDGPVEYDENSEPVLNILGTMHPYANYVVFDDDTWEMLEVPSAFNTGVKLVKGFTINAEKTTEVILDFDAYKSVIMAGQGKRWQLKPTIKVLSDDQENWVLYGTVTSGGVDVQDVLVSVQYPDPEEPKNIVRTSTLTDADGNYMIFVAPPGGSGYHVVAYKGPRALEAEDVVVGTDFLGPECKLVAQGDNFTNNFSLSDALVSGFGFVRGSIEIRNAPNIDELRFVTLSFRTICPVLSKEIEVLSINLSEETGNYKVALPVGVYTLVASSGDILEEYGGIMVESNLEKDQPVALE